YLARSPQPTGVVFQHRLCGVHVFGLLLFELGVLDRAGGDPAACRHQEGRNREEGDDRDNEDHVTHATAPCRAVVRIRGVVPTRGATARKPSPPRSQMPTWQI